ncbi:MAG: hypothetical protein AVDCRST_MAG78-1201 [uncultured Rubrobacteraceae bacterium]|uniref:Uncharacterized protein n=1 Tax=uncultured Rubrobacteraceae bacterium TaxID=349277 RepID=A0A6J4PW38_9ACTN|nr:MAG: hypothetical protein AVDCRST_MAG78-1201 [uncultured Rubrobacteraceae bacterium]
MKRFARSDDGNGEGRKPVSAQRNGEDTLPRPPVGGVVAGGRKFSRGQAIRLLGGGFAGAALLSVGLTRTAAASTSSLSDSGAYQASVQRAFSGQTDLIEDREHCSAHPERLKTIGRAIGQQVRIERSSSQYALYTVSEPHQESPDNVVRMGLTGRQRLGTSDEFAATLNAQVPHPTFTEAEAEDRSEFVERLKDNGTHKGLIAIAPHGGQIEPYTDQQAERVAWRLARKKVSSWRCKGWKQGGGAHDRWHITSTDIHPASFPRLNRVISRGFRYAVAFHGFGQQGILIGGAAPDSLKREIEKAIERAVVGSGIEVRIAQPGDDLGGGSSRNVVNRLTAGGTGGIQIEQSFSARKGYGQAIADAVAGVYRSKLR